LYQLRRLGTEVCGKVRFPGLTVEVIVNGKAGLSANSESLEKLKSLIEAACPAATIVFADANMDVDQLARDAVQRGRTMIVAGGGDGTINAVSSAVAGTETVLGVLPLGTWNHFAKDLGIPAEPEAAVRTLVTGSVRTVDVGEVNGRVFVNNSALGLYPEIVRQREKQQKLGASKWLAAGWAVARALVRYRLLTVRVTSDGRQLLRTTPIVFVGNNPYAMEGLEFGGRSRLDSGELCMVIPHDKSRLKLLWLTLRALLGQRHRDEDFDIVLTTELSIESRRRNIHVTLDGEITSMKPPLRYRIRPGALRVIVPGPEE
jgi:YegS/Rv2252/BmrU family lipid kinase